LSSTRRAWLGTASRSRQQQVIVWPVLYNIVL
jgi:hypothetical protein